MGGVVSQDKKTIAFFAQKFNAAQKNYPIIKKELLSLVETIKEYWTILWRRKIIAHTDYKNLTYPGTKFLSDRVLQQRLLLEEYGVELNYIQGKNNILADA